MPLQRTLHLRSVTDAEFDLIDKAVMRCGYASQNKFGRLFDERIYENAFVVTAFHSPQRNYQRHIEVLLEHVTLASIQWINVNRNCLEVSTIERNDRGMGTEE